MDPKRKMKKTQIDIRDDVHNCDSEHLDGQFHAISNQKLIPSCVEPCDAMFGGHLDGIVPGRAVRLFIGEGTSSWWMFQHKILRFRGLVAEVQKISGSRNRVPYTPNKQYEVVK